MCCGVAPSFCSTSWIFDGALADAASTIPDGALADAASFEAPTFIGSGMNLAMAPLGRWTSLLDADSDFLGGSAAVELELERSDWI